MHHTFLPQLDCMDMTHDELCVCSLQCNPVEYAYAIHVVFHTIQINDRKECKFKACKTMKSKIMCFFAPISTFLLDPNRVLVIS